tara:strand:+ start:1848 stop:2093 length:246 start_codon:yes stop_codon:yes gene_type:complete
MKIPSPCIDVCKYKFNHHCIGCSMTKIQKKTFKKLKSYDNKKKFIKFIYSQQKILGRFKHWEKVYQKKCDKKDVSFKDLII